MLSTMSAAPYSVTVVLDRAYCPLLRELFQDGPVWAVDSAANRECAQQLWKEHPDRNHLDGITIFKSPEDRSPGQMLIDHMGTIDDHHGVFSADPAYTVLRVIGSGLTQEIRDLLSGIGFNVFTATDEGFQAVRPLPDPLGR